MAPPEQCIIFLNGTAGAIYLSQMAICSAFEIALAE
jgi:hypothetical protein